MTLPKGFGHKVQSEKKMTFVEWWASVPDDLKNRTRKGDENNRPLLNQVNYALLHLHLAGKHNEKPSHEELKEWLHSGQIDVVRMGSKTVSPPSKISEFEVSNVSKLYNR